MILGVGLGEDCNKINYQPLAYQTKRGQRKKCVNPLDKMIEFSVLFPGCDPQMKLSQVTGARGPVGTTGPVLSGETDRAGDKNKLAIEEKRARVFS